MTERPRSFRTLLDGRITNSLFLEKCLEFSSLGDRPQFVPFLTKQHCDVTIKQLPIRMAKFSEQSHWAHRTHRKQELGKWRRSVFKNLCRCRDLLELWRVESHCFSCFPLNSSLEPEAAARLWPTEPGLGVFLALTGILRMPSQFEAYSDVTSFDSQS